MIDCLKRHVVCIILDAQGNVLATGRNKCKPPGHYEVSPPYGKHENPVCARMHITENQKTYVGDGCNSVHAEINAIAAIKLGDTRKPAHAILIGHEFVCTPCTLALKAIGITAISICRISTGNFLDRDHILIKH